MPKHATMEHFTAAVMAALLLCCTPATSARFLQETNATSAATPAPSNTTTSPSPSPLSEVYNDKTFANNPNFTFLPGYTTQVTGTLGTLDYTIQAVNSSSGTNISVWHDIPLGLEVDNSGDITLWTLVEIPIGEQAKYETQSSKPGNPIQQDTNEIRDANGNVTGVKPRYYMYGPSLGNYGGLPGTWSNSNVTDNTTNLIGDNDPLDVLDISDIRAPIGGVYRVKVLGVLGMIDKNETDWKVIVINVKDPKAATYSNISDVDQAKLDSILQFFANYKAAEKKPNACFWPVKVYPSSNDTAPVPTSAPQCVVPAAARPADYFHGKEVALKVIERNQRSHAWLLAGNCGSEACEDLWWAAKGAAASEVATPAASG